MGKIDTNYLLTIIGIILIVVEIVLGAATGFDLLLLGLILILSAAMGMIFKSTSVTLISIIILVFLYILIGRKLIKQKLAIETKMTNVDALIGKKGIVIKKIFSQTPGQVKIEGEIWRARSDREIDVDAEVTVRSVSGVTLKVE